MSVKIGYLITFVIFHALASANPATTSAPALPALPELQLSSQTQLSTNYFRVYATPIPDDEYYMGFGQGIFPDGGTTNYWIGCNQHPYTVSAGYAGCGSDDLYTKCVGDIAKAKDGTDMTCRASRGFACVTAEIYDNLDATDYTSWIKCGDSGSKTQLARTPTGESTTPTGLGTVTGTGTATLTTPNLMISMLALWSPALIALLLV